MHTSNWEALHHLIKILERDGIAPAGDFLQAALSRPDGAVDADLVKELAHLLFRIAERNGWTKDALSFNNLVTSWPEILDVARAREAADEHSGCLRLRGEGLTMATLSNRDRIGRMFEVLAPALDDFISSVIGQADPAMGLSGPSSSKART